MTVGILDSQLVEQMGHLQRLAEAFLKPLAVAAAQRQLRAVSKVDGALAGERRSQFFDTLDVDDRLSMNADEVLGIELGFQTVHRFAEQVRLVSDMETHVVAGRFAPVDFGRPDEVYAAGRADEQPVGCLGGNVLLP